MKKIWFSTLITLPTIAFAQSEASICINEIMQSNIDCLMIEHDFPDSWVELYNPTDDDIALKGYFLGTTNDVMSAYQFISSDTIYAHGYFLILCDNRLRTISRWF